MKVVKTAVVIFVLSTGLLAQNTDLAKVVELNAIATKQVQIACAEEVKSKDLKIIAACAKGFISGMQFGMSLAYTDAAESINAVIDAELKRHPK